MTKIWANSADSHVLEPADLWLQSLPPRLARAGPARRARRQVRDPLHRRRADGPSAERLHGRHAPAGGPGPRHPAEGPRSRRRLGPARVPVHGLLDRQDHRPGAGPGDGAGLERLGARRDPEQEQAGHPHRVRVHRRHRRRGRRAGARRRARLPGRVPAQPDPPRRGVRTRGVGAVLGRRGAGRRRARLPHRHRRGHRGVPRSRRRHRQLHGDDLSRHAGGVAPGRRAAPWTATLVCAS